MRRAGYFKIAILIITTAILFMSTSCFISGGLGGNSSTETPTPVKPKPGVASVVATTSGTPEAYYAILDIKVKNDGAEGTILVVASITQNGKVTQDEMPVYLKQGETHELKLTFPLVWKGGEWTSNVQTQVP